MFASRVRGILHARNQGALANWVWVHTHAHFAASSQSKWAGPMQTLWALSNVVSNLTEEQRLLHHHESQAAQGQPKGHENTCRAAEILNHRGEAESGIWELSSEQNKHQEARSCSLVFDIGCTVQVHVLTLALYRLVHLHSQVMSDLFHSLEWHSLNERATIKVLH